MCHLIQSLNVNQHGVEIQGVEAHQELRIANLDFTFKTDGLNGESNCCVSIGAGLSGRWETRSHLSRCHQLLSFPLSWCEPLTIHCDSWVSRQVLVALKCRPVEKKTSVASHL